MSIYTGLTRFIFLPVFLLVSAPLAGAQKTTELISKLDELDRAIAESSELSARSGKTVEELRKSLYQSAVQMRNLKKVGDEIKSSGGKDDTIKEQQELLRAEISTATAAIRDVNTRLQELEQIVTAGQDQLKAYENEIATLKDAVIDPDKAAELAGKKKIASLQAQLKDASDLAEERGKAINRLNRELKAAIKTQSQEPAKATTINAASMRKFTGAKKLLDAGNIDEALVQFNELMYENPGSDEVRLGLAACYFERDEFSVAKGLIDEVLSRDKANAWALGLQGAIQLREGKIRDARKSLEKSIKLDESNPYTHNYLGVALFQSARKEEGMEAVKKALALDKDYIPALYNMAVMMASSDVPDLMGSRYYYERALALGSARDPLMDKLLNLTP